MAPSRRKGANRAAAAAAAQRKWKLGDLVLAKVKGFPAWPATVSEPEKWGHPADRKKIVVQFFGCQQIAFCNPADVEEFTEEKKVSLLGKRHGKGADFGRAVNEIIDCFEKLKKQDQVGGVNGSDGSNIINENTAESLTECVKDEGLLATVETVSVGTINDLNSLTEAAVAAAAEDALHRDERRLVEVPSNSVPPVTPVSTSYSTRNKTDVDRSRKSGSRRRKSARVLRSSSKMDSSKLQSIMLPSTINTRSARRSSANASEDRSLRRSKRIVKSSDDSVGEDANSLALSNKSIEESDSEIMTADSDTLSINGGTTVDSGSKPVESEKPFTENNEAENELSDRLDFQSNNVIIKKKRKPNRKRHNNDTAEAAKHDIVASDAEMLKTECVSPTFSGKSTEKYVKDDGDEHLPLVKRARVRMGRPSPVVEEEGTLVHKEEKMLEAFGNLASQSFEPPSCQVDASAGRESVLIKEGPTLSSLSHVSPARKPNICDSRKNFVDEEAALPPSKRLHRALEAMSANVAEDCEKTSNGSPAPNIQRNGYCPSFTESSEKAVTELKSGATEDLRNDDSLLIASEFCIMSNMKTPENDSKTVTVVSDCVKTLSNCCSDPELCRDSFEHADGADSKRLKLSSNGVTAENNAEHCVKLDSLDVDEHFTHLNCNTADMTISSSDQCKTEHLEWNEVAERSDPNIPLMNSDSKCVEEIAGGSPNDTCVMLDSADDEGDETHKKKNLVIVDKDQGSKRSEIVEAASLASLDSNTTLSVTPVKVLNSGHRHSLPYSAATSNDNIDDRTVSITQCSSSLTDGPDCVARASPPSSSVCYISALDNNNSLENNSSSSPVVQLHDLHLEKAKLAGRSSGKGESLSAFEAVIRSLTRTKESIGRATRIAIDCAKLGFATKVVEMLAHNLESESSLRKKVDLFFLVDSITQCSRGIKGDGGVYPSAIKPLLPRLLLAAAPPGSSSRENHRQCLKVLRVWQERKILPEPIIRHHIRELNALCGSSYPIVGSQRPLRNERAFDDPVREMEGMLVDEYGSNSSIQLPGFCMPPMMRDEDGGSDSDGESFEAVTPEHSVENHEGEKTLISAVEKRSHILEDVDGELEMEDVAPCCEVEIPSTSSIAGADHKMPNHHSENHYAPQFTLQRPTDVALTSAPLSRSPLPPLPPPPPPPPPLHPLTGSAFPHGVQNPVSNGHDSKPYSSCQNFNGNFQDSIPNQSVLPRVQTTAMDMDNVHHRVRENKDFQAQVPRQMPDSNSACSFSDRSTSYLSSRASNGTHRTDAFGKGFHLQPPHPAPSNQFSYVQEQRMQSRRDVPPPSHSNRFHTRNSENGNFYKDRGRNKFVPRDNIGECWRPPFPSVSGPCYPDDARMAHAPMSYSGPPCEPALPNNRWNVPPRPMNHRHFNYRPPSEGPVPVTNRGPNFWRPR